MPQNGQSEPSSYVHAGELTLRDYLAATAEAAKRSRSVTIALVVAVVLVFAALLNSLHSSWMLLRVRAAAEPYSTYVAKKIGSPPLPAEILRDRDKYQLDPRWKQRIASSEKAIEKYDARYELFYRSLVDAYVQSAYEIRVPFFGFRFDVNDLTFLGAFGFIIILLMYRFCLAREIANVRAAFRKAEHLNRVADFYELLSLHQVFTVPDSKDIERGWFQRGAPKAIWALPLVLQIIVVLHDLWTLDIGFSMDSTRTKILLAGGPLLVVLVVLATVPVFKLSFELDRFWDEKSAEVRPDAEAQRPADGPQSATPEPVPPAVASPAPAAG